MTAPAVSVVMPVYNGERYLPESIESLLRQTLESFELLAVDDGSSDAGGRILDEAAATDPRVVVHHQDNGGVAAALNRGLALARAPLIARLDADDLAMPDRLREQRQFLLDNPEVGMVGGKAAVIDERGREIAEASYPLDDGAIREQMRETTPFVHSSVMIRAEVLEQVGGYRAQFEGAEDLDLWLRISERSRLANLAGRMVAYRIHPDQVSNKIELQAFRVLAARESARRRREGLDDSLLDLAPLDEAALLSLGLKREQVDAGIVEASVWLAKTADRAGYRENAHELFAVAWRRARASADRGRLAAMIRAAEAQRRREQGHPLRARLLGLAGKLAERGPGG